MFKRTVSTRRFFRSSTTCFLIAKIKMICGLSSLIWRYYYLKIFAFLDYLVLKVQIVFKSICIPIGQRPIALLDSSKSINIKSISTAATIYLMSTALQNCKINCLYSVLPGKLEVIMLITLINWYKSYVLFHCHNIDHSNNNNR